MLNRIIAASLRNRAIVLLFALIVGGYGLYKAARTPIDVLPDLNRPIVTIMTEAHGMVLLAAVRNRGYSAVSG